ncbi:uncharacterized protein N7529_011246 [Penicillium soppii]|uniref:uncharacterized protein n=1 Tax=Penicillium soppii TaxID=69789 RepID=UPI0025499D6E|nr:uncharacterized protein N7529_011246 [Penicillium soppii]KAJ5851861.1 hypothetical protein N7529_011246 [Penicillium soppii]
MHRRSDQHRFLAIGSRWYGFRDSVSSNSQAHEENKARPAPAGAFGVPVDGRAGAKTESRVECLWQWDFGLDIQIQIYQRIGMPEERPEDVIRAEHA